MILTVLVIVVLIYLFMKVFLPYRANRANRVNRTNKIIKNNKETNKCKSRGHIRTISRTHTRTRSRTRTHIKNGSSSSMGSNTPSRPKESVNNTLPNYSDFANIDDINSINEKFNRELLENVYHMDYTDVNAAIAIISPHNRNEFNKANRPEINSWLGIDHPWVKEMVGDFVNLLNHKLKSVPLKDPKIGQWATVLPGNHSNDKWNIHMQSLGLPGSLYKDPNLNRKIKLAQIESVEKTKTDDETKYTMKIVLKKINVKDLMLLKINLLQNNNSTKPTPDEFDTWEEFLESPTPEAELYIESVFVLGYYINKKNNLLGGDLGDYEEQYEPYTTEYITNITDDNYVQAELAKNIIKKHYQSKFIESQLHENDREKYDT